MRLRTTPIACLAAWTIAALSGACSGGADATDSSSNALRSDDAGEPDAIGAPDGEPGDGGGGGGGATCKGKLTGSGTLDCSASLFVTEPETLAKFSLQAVLEQIVSTASDPSLTALGFYQQLLDTLNDKSHGVTSGPHCTGTLNGFPIECPRQEGALASTNPFKQGASNSDAMFPVGVVNRFDLAPADGANCGQYRVVFAKQSGVNDFFNRFFLIFEAVLPNPGFKNDGKSHLAACKAVPEFWAGLSKDTPAERATALEGFYFKGLSGFAPVFQAANYGFGNGGGTNSGQIRSNMFMFDTGGGGGFDGGVGSSGSSSGGKGSSGSSSGIAPGRGSDSGGGSSSGSSSGAGSSSGSGSGGGSSSGSSSGGSTDGGFSEGQQWELREFRLSQTCKGSTCSVLANNVFVATNPFGALFGPGQPLSAAFQKAFLAQVPALATSEKTDAKQVIPLISMSFADEFMGGESDEQDFSNDYAEQGSRNAFLDDIDIELKRMKRLDLSAVQILNRATTQSCAGCHEVSVGADLGDKMTWPFSNTFTQIDENSNLSPALQSFFLPFRMQVMIDFLENGSAVPADPKRTVGGQRTGAAN